MTKLYLTFIASLFATQIFAQQSNHTFVFADSVRKYILYVPVNYDTTQPVPLVLLLHGLGGTANSFNSSVGFKPIADTANFIYAVPEAIIEPLIGQTAWNSGAGAGGLSPNQTIDDVGFLNALIDSIAAHYNIDSTRLYATGFSMGGYMTNRLGCELSHRLAAIASVAGTIGDVIDCEPATTIPTAHFHGTSDGTVPYANNQYGMDAEETTAFWVSHNRCDTTAVIDTFPDISGDNNTVVHYVYPNGDEGTRVELFKVINGAHHWWRTPQSDISCSAEVWKFFRQFQRLPTNETGMESAGNGNASLHIYPNPTQNVVAVEFSQQHFDIEMLDIAGSRVYSVLNVFEKVEIDCTYFASGIYFIRLTSSQGAFTQKFVKE